ncbi:uncharacterized protein LOC106478480 [Limulus polyphemus]|uniref:Uncharacterized protein LOC106478480 n=1 Tax=Limulus polyphemus TaxID=6850 RepID=A0ABM1S3G9_LIMPO|nr:uncharacterized protein LOC106478480 [Limulus polyphemus]
MLKHVHLSSSGLSPYRCRTPARDTVSLNSTLSFSSCSGHDPLSSRSSSTSSLHDVSLSPKSPKVVVKVYARVLSVDVEYKTLSIGPQTTSKEVVCMLLNKFRMKHRDPNLYYLAMEVWIRKTGLPIRTVMVLDDEAKPGELQACHPRSEIRFFHSTPPVCRFLLQMRRGGLVKVYDSCLMTGSLYKSLLISDRTTTEEVIQLLLHCYNSKERPNKFSLFEISSVQKYERKLHQHDYPLLVQQEWPNREQFSFHLRRNSECLQKTEREVGVQFISLLPSLHLTRTSLVF